MKTVFLLLYIFVFLTVSAKADEPTYRNVGPLRALLLELDKQSPYVVFLHGWGGDGLSSYEALKDRIKNSASLKKLNWVFPDAPRGGWFDIEAIDPHTTEPLYAIWQETLRPTRRALEKMLSVLKLESSQIIWAGFSQGGITAIDYVLYSKEPPFGLIVDSGIYYRPTNLKKEIPHLKGIPFQMAHDPNDDVLPFEKAKAAEVLLQGFGMKGKLHEVQGHEMHPRFIESALEVLYP